MKKESLVESEDSSGHFVECMLCNAKFENVKEFCQHNVLEHKLVISDCKKIPHIKSYAAYWKKRFLAQPYTEICSVITIGEGYGEQEGDGPKEQVFLLSGDVGEDKLIREKLQRRRLEVVLEQHELERLDQNFDRECIFCKKRFQGNRHSLFQHMACDHNLSAGKPDNLVFIHQFLDLLEEKIDKNNQCLFCEKTFKDRATLKEHMRKKLHKKLNPKNTEFDKFYLINYLEVGKNWLDINAEDDSEIQEKDDDTEEQWGSWRDKDMEYICLFCECSFVEVGAIFNHMKVDHEFDLQQIKKSRKLNYYQQLKLINYIRRQMYQLCCFTCLRRFESHEELTTHLAHEKHISFIPETSTWDQPQYFFPTYENDNLLYVLEDDCSDTLVPNAAGDSPLVSGAEMNDLVESEEIVIPPDSILWNEDLRNQLCSS